MAKEIPQREPKHFIAGMTWDWDRSFADFLPSDGWELTYYFKSTVATGKDLAAQWGVEITANGEVFEVRIPHADTALEPGGYQLVGEINNDSTGKKHPIYNDRIMVVADPASAGAASTAQQMLTALDALLLARASGSDKKEIQVNGRRVEFADLDAIHDERTKWLAKVVMEQHPTGSLRRKTKFVNA